MKRFLIRIFLIIAIPIISCTLCCEYCIRQIPNDYAYKNIWMTNNIEKVRILCLGSSHSYFGIEPSIFSKSAFNASHVSQSIKYDHFIFTKFYDKMDSLQVLILPISYFSLTSNGPEGGIEDWRTKFYSIYYNCDYHRFEPKYNLEVWNGLHLDEIIDFVLKGKTRLKCNDLGRGTSYKLESRDNDWKQSGIAAAERHTKNEINDEIVCNNIDYAEDIIKMCASRKAKVIILTTPTYKTYRNNLDSLQLNIMTENSEMLERKYDNVLYINMLDDSRFVDDDFFDADHLNEYGAAKLTMILKQTIDSMKLLE